MKTRNVKGAGGVPSPTAAELGILKVLWSRGPSTVRDVAEVLERERPIGYTTVLKTLQIMSGKGLVLRDESRRTHVYAPALPEKQTLRRLARDLLERAFGGSAARLVLHALDGRRPSRAELDEIRALLDELERKR